MAIELVLLVIFIIGIVCIVHTDRAERIAEDNRTQLMFNIILPKKPEGVKGASEAILNIYTNNTLTDLCPVSTGRQSTMRTTSRKSAVIDVNDMKIHCQCHC